MGVGDALIASGRARKLYQETKQPVLIVGRHNVRYWSDLWDDVPYIIRRPAGRRYQTLVDGPGVRAYIAAKTTERWTWRPFCPEPAEIIFTPAELAFAEPYRGMVMIEPNVKHNTHTNKAWLWNRWQQVVEAVPEVRFVQCLSGHSQSHLAGVHEHVVTPTFRHACAVLSVCRAFVGTEGGLMHAAAAVGVPGVVVYGGFISPEVTGYPTHRNLFTGTGLGCGMRSDCQHCRDAMDRISVTQVVQELQAVLGNSGSQTHRGGI